jgi:hypothetical protein
MVTVRALIGRNEGEYELAKGGDALAVDPD